MERILMVVMAAGAVLGGLDRILGNRLGLGEQFEKGFLLLGPTALSMAGMICLAPVLADVLGAAVVPLYRALGVDPAMFGSVLAIDMGGYQLAEELAVDPRIGSYAGLIAAAVFGCTLVFTIPVGMGMIPEAGRPQFARGIMLGLVTMPVGLVLGGLACGLTVLECLHQNLPIFLLALLLLLGLWKIPRQMVKGFCLLAAGLKAVITAGLVLAAVEYMTGWNPIPGMAPIGDAMRTVAFIGVVMLGSLPVAELLRRALERPFTLLGSAVGLSARSVTGMLMSLATPLPVLSSWSDLDPQGQTAAAAFLVCGSSLLAAHTGFVAGTEPALLGALFAAKLSGALAAAVLAVLTRRKDACAST